VVSPSRLAVAPSRARWNKPDMTVDVAAGAGRGAGAARHARAALRGGTAILLASALLPLLGTVIGGTATATAITVAVGFAGLAAGGGLAILVAHRPGWSFRIALVGDLAVALWSLALFAGSALWQQKTSAWLPGWTASPDALRGARAARGECNAARRCGFRAPDGWRG
jgi:hypothetical protein